MSAHRHREDVPRLHRCRYEREALVELMRAIRRAVYRDQAEEAALEPLARLLRDRRERIACDWAHPD
jgi:hypothetical protein